MFVLASLLSGLVFGLGLLISGMVNPAKVLASWTSLATGTRPWRW